MDRESDTASASVEALSEDRWDVVYSPHRKRSPPTIELTSHRILDTLAAIARTLPEIRGRGAIAQILHKRLRPDGGYWSITMADGTKMIAARAAEMSWAPAFTGKYDRPSVDFIVRFLKPESYCLDIGACYGFYAVPLGLAARRRNAHVLAFEALPANAKLLHFNIVTNKLDSVVFDVLVALGRNHGTVEMVAEIGGGGNAFVRTSAFQTAEMTATVAATVQIERLDDLPLHRWTTKRHCSLIKMDIEGFEVEALSGAERFVAQHRPVIFGEFNAWFLERHGASANAPLDWASTHGYKCYELRRSRVSWIGDERRLTPWPLDLQDVRSEGADLLMLPAEEPELDRLLG